MNDLFDVRAQVPPEVQHERGAVVDLGLVESRELQPGRKDFRFGSGRGEEIPGVAGGAGLDYRAGVDEGPQVADCSS